MQTFIPSTVNNTLSVGTYEVMVDQDEGWEQDNACYHYSATINQPVSAQLQIDWVGSAPYGNIFSGSVYAPGNTNITLVLDAFKTVNHPSLLPPEKGELAWSIPDWSSEGWYAIYPYIRKELNGINSVYELKDFRMLPGLLRRTRKSARKFHEWLVEKPEGAFLSRILGFGRDGLAPRVKRWRRNREIVQRMQALTGLPVSRVPFAKKDSIWKILRNLARLAPDHFLNWEFAVAPLISDLEAVGKALATTTPKVRKLLKRADGTIQRGHFERALTEDDILKSPDVEPFDGEWKPGLIPYRKVWSLEEPVYHLSVHYSFSFSPEMRQIADALGRTDAFGLSASPAVIWRATRWSFVVDWFLKIGPMLDRLEPHQLEPVVSIHTGSESVKYAVVQSFEVSPYRDEPYEADGIRYSIRPPQVVAVKREEVYVRKRRIPSLLGMPKTSDFSTMEKLLALALALGSVRWGAQSAP